jgi:NNP family nitrate/nitrite transporter-like MFS transporter
MLVTNRNDFFLLILMKLPMYGALALLTWKLSQNGVSLLSEQSAVLMYLGLCLLFIVELIQTYKVNINVFQTTIPAAQQYRFKQVAVLNVLYFATFGSELAVISMLPLFFAETFALDMVFAAMLASTYAFMNLMSRPGGGWLSDKFGRKKTLLILTAGLALGYFAMSLISASWPLALAVVTAMLCSFFVQAGEGAVFAAVPLIKRSLTGQIAGMTGAYGNVGAVVYLTVLTFVPYSQFFLVIAATAVIGFVALLFMEEPKGSIVEVHKDGTVELISVS